MVDKPLEQDRMKRALKIYKDPIFEACLNKNKEAEKDRTLCKHDLEHFLTVARLAYIFSLERGYEIKKDVIYAASLLHDIGKWKQYLDGTPHEIASAEISKDILQVSDFDENEKEEILEAILSHRSKNKASSAKSKLSEVLYDGDKLSRQCFMCRAQEECNWSDEKKNLIFVV